MDDLNVEFEFQMRRTLRLAGGGTPTPPARVTPEGGEASSAKTCRAPR
jgi:hypothetical protein